MGELDLSGVDEMERRFSNLINTWGRLKNFFQAGFKVGFGDTSVLDSIQNHIANIKESLNNIFKDEEVQQAETRFSNIFSRSLGQIAGSVASIGATIADNVLGGIDLYLQQNSQRIKDYIVSMFDIGSDISEISGKFAIAVADIFSAFRSDSAKQITADIIQIFSDAFIGVTQLGTQFALDVVSMFAVPIINNSGQIKVALEGILTAVQAVTSSIAETVRYFVDGIIGLYNEHIDPLFQSLRDGFSEIVGVITEAFNTYILPVIQNAADQFSAFCTYSLQPLIDKFIEFSGKAIDAIKELWEKVLQPFIVWFIQNIAPIIASGLQTAVNAFFAFLNSIASVIGSVLEALGGLIDFIVGVFTGDWERAWNGIKTIFKSVWDSLVSIVKLPINTIIGYINSLVDGIASAVNFISKAFNSINLEAPDWVPLIGGKSLSFNIPTFNPPKIPALAHGGFVEANTPRLAMIGDNRRYGEIVAPEDKMQEMIDIAISKYRQLSAGSNIDEYDIYRAFKRALSETDLVAVMDSDKAFKTMQKKAGDFKNRTGKPAFGY